MTDEPTPLPTMGDALKQIFARYRAAGLDGYGDNGVIGWFLAMEADNKDLRERVAELEAMGTEILEILEILEMVDSDSDIACSIYTRLPNLDPNPQS